MSKLVLVRGLPGSGKSTFASQLGYAHFEADMFFMVDGVYKFNPELLKDAHTWCQNQVKAAMAKDIDVVVSNTFVKKWEMDAYLTLAKEYEYTVNEITLTGDYKNVHNVPVEVVERMRANWEY